MALAYTAPTWTDGSGEGISASNMQAISNCIEGLVQGSDKAVHDISFSGSTMTLTFADGTIETVQNSGIKGISSIEKTGTAGNIDTYTITYSDGTTSSYTVTNGTEGATPDITMSATADATSSANPSVTVTKGGTTANPTFALAFSGLKGAKGSKGDTGAAGANGQDGQDGVSPEVSISTITGGHTVTITDADHPSGQSFNVMDGQDGASDWSEITNKPNFATVATSGSYSDLSNKPTLPTWLDSTTYSDSSGTRTFSFSNAAITTTSKFDYYANVFNVAPTDVVVASGSLQVKFKTSDGVTECAVEVN